MKRQSLVAFAALFASLFAASVSAHAGGLKPGLWEFTMVRQTVDGQDMAARMAAAQSQMKEMLERMPPEQRAQLQARMGAMPGGGGSWRMCIGAHDAAQDAPPLDRSGRCRPTQVQRSGNTTRYAFDCTIEGRHQTGSGQSVAISDNEMENRLDATTQDGRGTHTMHTETRMKYLGTDCGKLKPLAPSAR